MMLLVSAEQIRSPLSWPANNACLRNSLKSTSLWTLESGQLQYSVVRTIPMLPHMPVLTETLRIRQLVQQDSWHITRRQPDVADAPEHLGWTIRCRPPHRRSGHHGCYCSLSGYFGDILAVEYVGGTVVSV